MTPMHMLRPSFLERVAAAEPGEAIVYHTGSLMWDRQMGQTFLGVNSTAVAAWEAMEDGKVNLFQRQIAQGVFEYRAVKRALPHDPIEWTGCYAKSSNSKPKARQGSVPILLGSEVGHHQPA